MIVKHGKLLKFCLVYPRSCWPANAPGSPDGDDSTEPNYTRSHGRRSRHFAAHTFAGGPQGAVQRVVGRPSPWVAYALHLQPIGYPYSTCPYISAGVMTP